jgi:soluble lytic murein transglycosylase-like protein
MKTFFVCLALSAAAWSGAADDRAFTASAVPHAKLRRQGKVVIRNSSSSITAYRFFGNVQEALVALKSKRVAYRPFGPSLFNTNARVPATMPPALQSVIADAARTHGVDPRLVFAVAGRESAFNSNAISPVGACGLMQLMPATARYLGVTNIFDPRDNVFAGTRYLRTLLDTFHGDLDLALAAYNAGPGAVQKYNGIPPYRETQNYVRAVRSRYEAALALQ